MSNPQKALGAIVVFVLLVACDSDPRRPFCVSIDGRDTTIVAADIRQAKSLLGPPPNQVLIYSDRGGWAAMPKVAGTLVFHHYFSVQEGRCRAALEAE